MKGSGFAVLYSARLRAPPFKDNPGPDLVDWIVRAERKRRPTFSARFLLSPDLLVRYAIGTVVGAVDKWITSVWEHHRYITSVGHDRL